MLNIKFDKVVVEEISALKNDNSKKNIYKAVIKTIKLMQQNLRHPSLNTHKFKDVKSKYGYDLFESYVQNKTPSAYRLFWRYGPNKSEITILSVTKHP